MHEFCQSSRSDKLKQHIEVVHEKKKPFSCDVCAKEFSAKSCFEKHYRIKHKTLDENSKKEFIEDTRDIEGKETYFCKICEKQVLYGHGKEYHENGNVKCPKCDKVFLKYEKGWFAFVSS